MREVAGVTVAGVDLGGSKIAGVLLDESGTIRGELWQEHRIQGPDQAVELIGEVVGELMAREPAAARVAREPAAGRMAGGQPVPGNTAAGSRRELRSVGLAVAGWLSRDRQDVRSAVNLGITTTPLARLAQARLNCPVIVENDGNAAAYAEFTRGAGQQAQVLMLITLGTGVGGGIVSSGTLVQGSHGLAGELGHIPVDRSGPGCICGGRGCLELYASGAAVTAQARMRAGQPGGAALLALAAGQPGQITSRQVVEAARGGDACAAGLLAAAGRAIGQAVAQVMPVVDPDLVVLTGSLATSAGDLILAPARQELARQHALRTVLDPVPMMLSQTGPGAAALCAAELARRHPAARALALARPPLPR
jgi:glucokinase